MLKWIKKKRKGFTLVELIVVIAIIGILVLIAVPRFGSITDAAEQRTVEANHRILISAAQMYYAENLAWPAPDDRKVEVLEPFIDASDFDYSVGGHELIADGTTGDITIQSWWGAATYAGQTDSNLKWEWNSTD